MPKFKVLLSLSLSVIVSQGAYSAQNEDLPFSKTPTCTTLDGIPGYYAATKSIKLPWVDLSGDGTDARYCAILKDLDQNGRFELLDFDQTNFFPSIEGKVVFNEATGTAQVTKIVWLEADGNIPYFGSLTLQQESDGQFSIHNLILHKNGR